MDESADLSHLADIVVPTPISWWPPALGWWILGAALLILLAALARGALRRYQGNAYRRAALAELSALASVDNGAGLAIVSSILKRVALVSYPRPEVASLTGDAWAAFLDRTAGTSAFTKGSAAGLAEAAAGGSAIDGPATLREARRWIARHRAEV